MSHNVYKVAIQMARTVPSLKEETGVTGYHILYGYSLLFQMDEKTLNLLFSEEERADIEKARKVLEENEILYSYAKARIPTLFPLLGEDYCKWCYADGTYTYSDMEDLINVCVKNMVTDNFTEEQARSYMKELLPKLDYWKRYDELSDHGEFEKFKKKLLKEINALHVEGLPEITRLNALVGKYVNLEYTLPNGRNVKFLDDQTTYLGTQSESEFEGDRYFGVLAGMDFILICTYEADRTSPELVLYKKR